MLTADLLLDATLLPAMGIALVAGLLSFLSPCVLPIVPPYLAYMGGISMGELAGGRVVARRVMLPAVLVTAGVPFALHCHATNVRVLLLT